MQADSSVRARWKRPVVWVSVWLCYSLVALGYFAYESAERGMFCMSNF
ncbi:hypothetical protein [Nitrincola sp. A-D6]|nr:hypothetical protein [Nitrincola sp. A-D6]